MTTREQVVLYLRLMKMAAAVQFIFANRAENLGTLARLGITRREAQALVLGMCPEDYSSGPSEDHNCPGLDVWVFGLLVNGVELYVKTQVVADPPERCVCISFHEAQRPMRHPLRQS